MVSFSFALTVASFVLALLACLFAAASVTRVTALQHRLRSGVDVSSRLTEIEQALAEVATSVRMMKTRRAARGPVSSAAEIPDPYSDPDRWRQHMNRKLAERKLQ